METEEEAKLPNAIEKDEGGDEDENGFHIYKEVDLSEFWAFGGRTTELLRVNSIEARKK